MSDLTRPIIGIENRTAQEVFDIMCDRIRSAEAKLAGVEDRVKEAWALGRRSYCPAGVLADEARTEREWQAARAALAHPVPTHNDGGEEALHLTEYELQVLLGTSIHGCNMRQDRVFSLDMAWHRLYALGLIDRTDGLAIITDKGRSVVDRMLSHTSGEVTEAEPRAFLVHDFHVPRMPVKAQGRFPEPTEYLYPACRADDAKEAAKIMHGTCMPLFAKEGSE